MHLHVYKKINFESSCRSCKKQIIMVEKLNECLRFKRQHACQIFYKIWKQQVSIEVNGDVAKKSDQKLGRKI